MHPAYSVILFTTASGAGYGLLALLIIFRLFGIVPADFWLGLTGFGAAFALITLGLLSSTFHLGRPERAWRAISQWRTSWLSREGVMAILTYVPAGLFAIGWIFTGETGGLWTLAGWLGVLCSAGTVYCTGMIYASLKTVPQWRTPHVTPAYMILALATGAVCLTLLLGAFGMAAFMSALVAILALAGGLIAKLLYWNVIDNAEPQYDAGAATGLGRYGAVRQLEPAHSTPNFVMREMGYKVARKHARRLRMISAMTGFVIPLAAMLPVAAGVSSLALPLALLAFFSAALGIVIERWLFFAEAQHVVTLYYGTQTA